MTEYSKFNIIYRLQKWMDSVPGQTFLNYAYSWGASVVIAGTLFKLTHLPGANLMLFLGMGTEVIVFFLSAFDRPFDKTADGRDLPTHVAEGELSLAGGESVFAEGNAEGEIAGEQGSGAVVSGGGVIGGGTGGGTIIIGGGGVPAEGAVAAAVSGDETVAQAPLSGSGAVVGGGGGAVSWVAQQQETTPDMIEAQGDYVENLKRLNETLAKVEEQSMRLTRDSEEMENLNRTLTGISKVYEMQLKGASAQIGTIDEINEQTRKLAQQIAELNKIYARMIEAMTVNMPAAAAGLKAPNE